jgi:hypothetical protein
MTLTIVEQLLKIALIVFLGGIGACCSSFFYSLIREGQIFHAYKRWLERNKEAFGWWYKPMGGCSVCMNIWICILLYPIWGLFLGLIDAVWYWLMLPISLAVANKVFWYWIVNATSKYDDRALLLNYIKHLNTIIYEFTTRNKNV